jgi:hypothetical protein
MLAAGIWRFRHVRFVESVHPVSRRGRWGQTGGVQCEYQNQQVPSKTGSSPIISSCKREDIGLVEILVVGIPGGVCRSLG